MSAAWVAFFKTAAMAVGSFFLVWLPAHVGLLPIDPAYQAIIAATIAALAHNLPSPTLTAQAASASAKVISTSGR